MEWVNTLKVWLGRKSVRGGLLLLALLAIAAVLYSIKNNVDEAPVGEALPMVTLTSAQNYAGESTINLIGTVRAFSEASITSEKAGRITSVRVGLGDTVAAGQIIATIENASEQASVLQAQGGYDAAVAASAQSEVGTDEAETRLRSAESSAVVTIKSAYNTVENIIFNNVDQFFSSPESSVPGVRLDPRGQTPVLNSTRVQYQTELPAWKQRSNNTSVNDDLQTELRFTEQQIAKAQAFIDTFIVVLNDQNSSARYSEADIQAFATTFNSLRSNLNQLQNQVDSAMAAIESAEDGLERARLAASGGTTSAADAQIKQALGSLRSAQANLAKTIIRSPITGTVNALSIRTGDFVNSFVQVAEVANNNALEVVTYAGESDRSAIEVGETVMIEGQYQGTVTEIAPAVDSATGKTEVRVASESDILQNGDTVTITKQVVGEASTKVVIPLSAVKFQISDGAIFIVENGTLVLRPVALGTIRGGSVEILEGLSATEQFVADARGLTEGSAVEVMR